MPADLPAPLDLLPPLLEGLWITVQLTLGGSLLALTMALLAGFGRLAPAAPVRWLATVYVEVFRGTSALVQLFWFYFALPFFGLDLSPMTAGILVLGLNIGSYGAEVVRGAVQAVPEGQRQAAHALGFSRSQTLLRVVFPQAALAMVPPAGNLLIELLKNTALVSLITLHELTFAGQVLRASTLRSLEIFGLILVLYLLLAQALRFAMGRLERSLAAAQGRESAATGGGP